MKEEHCNSDSELTPLQEKAVFLLAGGKTISETAKALNIDRGTLYIWQKNSAFEAFYNLIRNELKKASINQLISLNEEALQVIKDLLKCKNENTRLKVASYILNSIKEIWILPNNKKEVEATRHF